MSPALNDDRLPAAGRQRLYNPDWLDDDDLLRGFVARQELFAFLHSELARAPRQGTVQHYLLVGVRGSGKTTLLKRLAIAVRRDDTLRDHLVALSFPEELYQVKHLADFWWAACEALVDELDRLGQTDAAEALSERLETSRPRGPQAKPLADDGLRWLLAACDQLGRRPVLLVDNLDLIFQRIDKHGRRLKDPNSPAYWALREALSRTDAPLVIAGSVRISEPFADYDKPFYDFFVPYRLAKLTYAEVERVLASLADQLGAPEVKRRLAQRPGRVEALYELTGGNPRALGMIFELLRQGPGNRALEDFERLMDLTTPYYKARFEELAEQTQVVMHALALRRREHKTEETRQFGHTAAEIGEYAGLETRIVSAQMDVLEKEGLIEKSAAQGRTQYRIAEQLFRLWLQMRGSRRVRQQVLGLAEFLEALFDREELLARWSEEATRNRAPLTIARLAFAHGEAQSEQATRLGLYSVGADRVLEHTAESGEALGDYLGRGDLPPDLQCLAQLRDRLQQCRDRQLNALPRNALLGAVWLKLTEKQASVEKLCDPASAQEALAALLPRLDDERRRLRRLGLGEADIDRLHAQRASGRLPLPELTPADFAAAVKVTGCADLRSLAWRLLAAPELVRVPDAASAAAWLAWCRENATNGDARQWADVAGTLRRNRLFDAAREALAEAFARGEPARAYYERAALLAESGGNDAEAEAAFRQAIAIDPADAAPWNDLGILLAKQPSRHDEAEAAYRQAIAIDPAYAVPWNNLGNLLAKDPDGYDKAEAAFQQAIAIDATFAVPWSNLGVLLAKKPDRSGQAEAAYRQAIAIDPAYATPWNNLGVHLMENFGRSDEAEAAYRQAIAIDPAFAAPWANLGQLMEAQQRLEEAERVYARAVELDHEDPYHWWRLRDLRVHLALDAAQSALKTEDWPRVRAALNELPALSPETRADHASWWVSRALVEGLIGEALARGTGRALLAMLREVGIERYARPLLIAVEAQLAGNANLIADSEPETRRAAQILFQRLESK